MQAHLYRILSLMLEFMSISIRYYAYTLIISPIGTLLGIVIAVYLFTHYHWYVHLFIWSYLIGIAVHTIIPPWRRFNLNAIALIRGLALSKEDHRVQKES